jgi:MSHA biogenesis protein MshO
MKARGFTIIEMVVALAISGIVVAFAALFIKAPIDSYLTQSRHATLVDSAGSPWPHLERDLHLALPNSVRLRVNGNVRVLELLTVVDSARYMTSLPAASFPTAGTFRGAVHSSTVKYYASINNLGTPAVNAYLPSSTMTNRTVTVASGALAGEDVVTINSAFGFPAGNSPKHRIYLVSEPVTYLCDTTAGTVQRYSGYTVASNQALRDTAAELNAASATSILVARNITACSFAFRPSTPYHGQIITARFTATRDGQTATMLHQAAVEPLQ